MAEAVSIQSRDYWVKASGWETWVLIEPADDGSVRVHFINEVSERFGELAFPSAEKAFEALRRNGFCRYTEDKNFQSVYRPPSPPFRLTFHPNLLYSIFWTDIPVSETHILKEIATVLKKYEPGFDLDGAFTAGVRGRADPGYSATRTERLRLLAVRKGLLDPNKIPENISLAESTADIFDQVGEDGAEADPRINWRVTVRHGDYYIHIMALDQGLSRFACCLQTAGDLEEGLGSDGRCPHTRYEAGNLTELDRILDGIYARFKQEDEQRRQQAHIDNAVEKAVEKEREIWRERLAKAKVAKVKRRKTIGLLFFLVGLFLLIGINEYFDNKIGDAFVFVFGAAIFSGLAALVSWLALVVIAQKLSHNGKISPWIDKIIFAYLCAQFLVLWGVLAYVVYMGWL